MPGGDTIGNLTAVVSATAEQFGADMKSIQSDLDALKSKAAEVGEKVPSAFEIGASVEMFKEGVRLAQDALESFLNVFEEAEALKHSAEVIGTTTSELSALRFAAMEAGVGAETFDNALTKLTQSIGKARDGSAQQIAALDKLGLDMNKLAGEDAGTAFTDVAEALSHVPNEADRARIAVELFGKTGQQLAPMFAEGADGIDKAIEKGKELGAILTDQEVEKEAKMTIAVKELGVAWKSFMRELGDEMIPLLKETIGLAEEGIKILSLLPKTGRFIGDLVGQALVQKQGADGMLEMPSFNDALKAAKFGQAKDQTITTRKSEDPGESQSQLDKHNKEIEKAREEAQKQDDELVKEIDRETEQMIRKAEKITEAARTPLEKFKDTLTELKSMLHEGADGISLDTFDKAAADAAEKFDKATAIKTKAEHDSTRSGIAGADLFSSTGSSLDLAAGRAAQDIAEHQTEIAEQHLAEAQRHTEILQIIAGQTGHNVNFPVADHH